MPFGSFDAVHHIKGAIRTDIMIRGRPVRRHCRLEARFCGLRTADGQWPASL